jgi:hypothetical protein
MHAVLSEIREMNMIVDFNQGLDARLIDDEKAKLIGLMKTEYVRTAYDAKEDSIVDRGIHLLIDYGIRPRKILVYLLYSCMHAKTCRYQRNLEIRLSSN